MCITRVVTDEMSKKWCPAHPSLNSNDYLRWIVAVHYIQLECLILFESRRAELELKRFVAMSHLR